MSKVADYGVFLLGLSVFSKNEVTKLWPLTICFIIDNVVVASIDCVWPRTEECKHLQTVVLLFYKIMMTFILTVVFQFVVVVDTEVQESA